MGRLLAVALGTLLPVALAWSWFHLRGTPVPRETSETPSDPSEQAHGPFDLALARKLFAEQLDLEPFVFDSNALLVRKANVRKSRYLDEHPRGKFRVRTNDLGFNEAEPTRRTRPDVRIVVAGDSHTQGVVDIDESYANLLEGMLRTSDPARSVDVLNAGVAYTGPACYLGMLRRCLALGLRPDVFVAALFVGNDFNDELRLDLALRGREFPVPPEGYWDPLLGVLDMAEGPVWQGFNQLYRFKFFPDEVDQALALTIGSYERMKELCDAQGILLVALVIPTKMDVDLSDDHDLIVRCQRELGLSDDDMRINLETSRRFVAAMQERGILCVDPTEAMMRADTPFYWRRDYHLNVAGHRFVAEQLNEALAGRL